MMKLRSGIFFYLLSILFCFQFCSWQNKDFIKESDLEIPDSLYSFYPKKESSGFTGSGYIETNARRKYGYDKISFFTDAYYIKAQLPSSRYSYNKLIKESRENAIDSLELTDDKYFIVRNQEDLFAIYDTLFLREKYQHSEYILPYFGGYTEARHRNGYQPLSICGLPDDFKIIILKSGRNFVLPVYKKYDWDILPQKVKHGYTSGVAYRTPNDMIVYWCIAW